MTRVKIKKLKEHLSLRLKEFGLKERFKNQNKTKIEN